MPAYNVELTTTSGERTSRFTLDDERPLGVQLIHILEEVRRLEVIPDGAPGDELTARWSDETLDLTRSPSELGISPFLPIQLQMRSRPQAPTRPPRHVPRAALAAPLAGATGALLAWSVTATGAWRSSGAITAHADVATGSLLGLCLAAATAWILATGETEPRLRASARGAIGGAVGGALAGALATLMLTGTDGAPTLLAHLTSQLVAWMLLGSTAAASIMVCVGLRGRTSGARLTLIAVAGGASSGAFAVALIHAVPSAELANALAALALGAGAAASAAIPVLYSAVALLSLERVRGRRVPLWRLREWVIANGRTVHLRRVAAPRRTLPALSVCCVDGGCRAELALPTAAGSSVLVSNTALESMRALVDGDTIALGDELYRYHASGRTA